ncbi:MAG: hypothetical protein E7541_05205, partial [Ruminococcaceae bacterium]|nr:hypothetical protein [Oscillospiraceae bacterium]
MRYVGLLLTVLAGVGLGLYFAHRLAVQVQFLNRLERLLEALERRMTYTARPVA